jgi:hypothetical protein
LGFGRWALGAAKAEGKPTRECRYRSDHKYQPLRFCSIFATCKPELFNSFFHFPSTKDSFFHFRLSIYEEL